MTSSLPTPSLWLRNPHVQTLWPKLFRPRPALPLIRERIELADGDFIDLSRVENASGPQVLLLHGLEGNLESHYARPVLACLREAGFAPVFMHLRGASGEPNRSLRTYHSGASDDLAEVLARLGQDGRPVAAAIGFSLGGNLLLKYLGEAGEHSLLRAAMAVSVPFELADAARRLEQGGSRLYQHYLLSRLKRSFLNKFAHQPRPFRVDLDRIATLRQYDQLVTAPLNGFAGADDYYTRCSSMGFLPRITTPTLILHSIDDPFMYPHNVPDKARVGPGVRLAIQPHGGHVGFVDGRVPWRCVCHIDRLAISFLREQLLAAMPSR
jgi:predicted alpha/beta-fold hydrolase